MGLTPMMQQYLQTKEKYSDCVLFYRLGDFYEMFFEDAVNISRELDLTLTGRDCGLENRAPMCGVPHHAAETYIAKLIEKGYKVAICEQLTEANDKGLVERDVVKIVTPGTVMETNMLDEQKNNYIASVFENENGEIGFSWADISTGEFYLTEIKDGNTLNILQENLTRNFPSEIIANAKMVASSRKITVSMKEVLPKFQTYHSWAFDFDNARKKILSQLNVNNLQAFNADNATVAICAGGALLEYLNETQKRTLSHINKLTFICNNEFMSLDVNTIRNLEINLTLRDRKKYGSLLWVLDKTKTAMGARNLNKWLMQPLQNREEIIARLDATKELKSNLVAQQELSEILSGVRDIERITAKIAYNSVSPKDMEILAFSLETLPKIRGAAQAFQSPLLKDISKMLQGLDGVCDELKRAIVENAPQTIKDGRFIRNGYNAELDSFLNAKSNAQSWLAQYEAKEKNDSGIKNLKVSYNRIFGYYIEITKSSLKDVPYTYTRKQTLANCERFITPELKAIEEKVLSAEDNAIKLEQKLFYELREMLLMHVEKLQDTAKAIAMIDTLLSFSLVANKFDYTYPQIGGDILEIKNGRHPVVESILKSEQFVPNDTLLDNQTSRSMLITGPNMAGKSTYMRQVALITLMAHIGCFVPATSAKIPIVDKIFTRVGASDNLAFSQSTFMVEMNEVANILNNATNNSLIILDEVGRGTSTYDGLSIAWSVMEYISKNLTAKTLFATHYHELTDLESKLDGVKNYQVMIKELADSIIFLRKIARGGADKSFGIEVAKLAGLPKVVIDRAKQILVELEEEKKLINNNIKDTNFATQSCITPKQSEVLSILRDINTNEMSPIVALNTLIELQNKAKL